LLPEENLIYVADSQYAPYGERTNQFIEERVLKIADFFIQKSVKLILIACNTATAAAVKSLRDKYDIPIVGLEPALKPAVEFSHNHQVGVLATQATLSSEKYHQLKSRFAADNHIVEKASRLFVELVESAAEIGESEFQLIEKELEPFMENSVDSLVLGCTHYPFLTSTIKQILGEHVTLFESAMPVAKEVKRRLDGQLNQQDSTGTVSFYSSAPQKAQTTFERLLGYKTNIQMLNV